MKKNTLYFITEQARCLAQTEGRESENFKSCRTALEYLAKGNQVELTHFVEQTAYVVHVPSGLEDYDIDEYEGKDEDMRSAIAALAQAHLDQSNPEDIRKAFYKTAEMIAGFYGQYELLDAAVAT
jgi:hypothetical protein